MSSSKNPEIEKTSFLTKSNSSFIENMYLRYIEKDKTLPVSWQSYFKSLDEEQSLVIKEIEGPTWNPNKKKINIINQENEKLETNINLNNSEIEKSNQQMFAFQSWNSICVILSTKLIDVIVVVVVITEETKIIMSGF